MARSILLVLPANGSQRFGATASFIVYYKQMSLYIFYVIGRGISNSVLHSKGHVNPVIFG